ncbi:serine peptidase [Chromobacterium sp. LK1]|uniref:S49 family peptidase n=1 Tax=Chromobacterium sp. LK1 TaxID=1628193 RepID=UPI000653B954|nr:S49 family peptidase [Chromobacterium sp. LK1]KMN32078.1 serine peptidase [Chromobacterium sp. LK1]
MINYPHLAQRLFNVPLAITPQKAEVVMAALADRFGLARLFHADGRVVALESWDGDIGSPAENKPYQVVAGVAVIPVSGTLVQKLGTMSPFSGMTGYDGIRANLSLALADDSVHGIVFDIDSPGGEVAGCFDLADAIYAARGEKPIWSILTENAYSAAYALASATDRIIVPRTGGTGSVGVICMHVDMSKALGSAGVNVTIIHYGDKKANGSDVRPLSSEALADIQSDVDEMGELFVETVARNRGIPTRAVRSTQAGTFMGSAGVKVGFADAVMAPDAAFRALLAKLG